MNIYELSQEAEALRLAIEEQGGEITPEQEKQLEVNAANAAEKVDYYYEQLADAKALDEAIAAEIKRLQARRKANAAYMDAVKGRMVDYMESAGEGKVNGAKGLHYARLTTSHPVEVDEGLLLFPFEKDIRALAAQLEGLARVTVEADKTAIKARLQAGEEIEGAAMGESHSVTFK